ncbi:MAG: AmmeMemoRadiSam system protein B [Patescibacteria group bacterium]|nr:AmmeMemoRadiSam system protein B [Patescibacteria group bacterium]
MKPRLIVLTAIITGIIIGLCAGVLWYLELNNYQTHNCNDVKSCVLLNNYVASAEETSPSTIKLPAGTVSQEMLDGAFLNKEDWSVKKGMRVILIPHHLVAARQIASLVSATPKPSKVYLVTPDHFGACKSAAYCSGPMEGEHAITGLVPFLQRAWGDDIEIIPTMVRPDATAEQADGLTQILIDDLHKDKKALLVATIDASHYLPAEAADFHDILTQDVIGSLADQEVEKTEIDAPSVLRVTLKIAREFGLGDVTIHAHTNSLRILQAQIAQESTSHFLASFAPGEIKAQQDVTLLFFGDMMFDRNVVTRSKTAGSLAYPFQKILGQENRFFRGQDFIVGNLEGPITDKRLAPDKGNVDFMFNEAILPVLKSVGISAVSQANNHTYDQGSAGAQESKQKIVASGVGVFGDEYKDDESRSLTVVASRGHKVALLGFNITEGPLEKDVAQKSIESAKKQSDFTVVFMHWGEEYQAKPNRTQIELAHWFIDQGVDAVIGSHPHWMQSVEVYKGKPVAYSLGNFIFDQDWSDETRLGLVVGLDLSQQGSKLHLYPIKINKSQPILLTGDDRQKRLDYLAGISDSNLAEQIKQGTLTINN